jgi:hypothetical protein
MSPTSSINKFKKTRARNPNIMSKRGRQADSGSSHSKRAKGWCYRQNWLLKPCLACLALHIEVARAIALFIFSNQMQHSFSLLSHEYCSLRLLLHSKIASDAAKSHNVCQAATTAVLASGARKDRIHSSPASCPLQRLTKFALLCMFVFRCELHPRVVWCNAVAPLVRVTLLTFRQPRENRPSPHRGYVLPRTCLL